MLSGFTGCCREFGRAQVNNAGANSAERAYANAMRVEQASALVRIVRETKPARVEVGRTAGQEVRLQTTLKQRHIAALTHSIDRHAYNEANSHNDDSVSRRKPNFVLNTAFLRLFLMKAHLHRTHDSEVAINGDCDEEKVQIAPGADDCGDNNTATDTGAELV